MRNIAKASFDFVVWVVAFFIAGLLRFEFDSQRLNFDLFLMVSVAAACLGLAVGSGFGLYRKRYVLGSLDELLAVVLSASLVSLSIFGWVALYGPLGDFPRSVPPIAFLVFLGMSGGSRVLARVLRQLGSRPTNTRRCIVYGAGTTAKFLLPRLHEATDLGLRPVALLDDDPKKQKSWIGGLRVRGGLSSLEDVISAKNADVIVIAIPSANSDLLQAIDLIAQRRHADVIICPSAQEMLGKSEDVGALRKIGIEELVGRRSVSIDTSAPRRYIQNKTVLITGAGGSIGSELARQVARLNPKRLVLLDRDETSLQQVLLSISDFGLLASQDFILTDIRDKDLLRRHLSQIRPDVVFHAAALKHVAALEKFPEEAWKTNVLGTKNLLEICFELGVERFINISTDKAADPTSVLGQSKLIGEKLTAHYSSLGEGHFFSVRFGNVLGSRGSVVPIFEALIKAGKPLRVTHPEATRFFMTIHEACLLVLQAGSETETRESIFILDMGNPVKIIDIANKMIQMSRTRNNIVITGLSPGEKIHEALYSAGDDAEVASVDRVWRIKAEKIRPEAVIKMAKRFKSAN